MFQGLILASRDRFSREAPPGGYGGSVTDGAGYLGALWGHECGRVFCDKMNTAEDKAWVEDTIGDLAKWVVLTARAVPSRLHALCVRACPEKTCASICGC